MRMGRVLCRSRPGWLFFDARSQPNCHQRSCMSYRHADSTRPILVYSFYNEKPVETRISQFFSNYVVPDITVLFPVHSTAQKASQ